MINRKELEERIINNDFEIINDLKLVFKYADISEQHGIIFIPVAGKDKNNKYMFSKSTYSDFTKLIDKDGGKMMKHMFDYYTSTTRAPLDNGTDLLDILFNAIVNTFDERIDYSYGNFLSAYYCLIDDKLYIAKNSGVGKSFTKINTYRDVYSTRQIVLNKNNIVLENDLAMNKLCKFIMKYFIEGSEAFKYYLLKFIVENIDGFSLNDNCPFVKNAGELYRERVKSFFIQLIVDNNLYKVTTKTPELKLLNFNLIEDTRDKRKNEVLNDDKVVQALVAIADNLHSIVINKKCKDILADKGKLNKFIINDLNDGGRDGLRFTQYNQHYTVETLLNGTIIKKATLDYNKAAFYSFTTTKDRANDFLKRVKNSNLYSNIKSTIGRKEAIIFSYQFNVNDNYVTTIIGFNLIIDRDNHELILKSSLYVPGFLNKNLDYSKLDFEQIVKANFNHIYSDAENMPTNVDRENINDTQSMSMDSIITTTFDASIRGRSKLESANYLRDLLKDMELR